MNGARLDTIAALIPLFKTLASELPSFASRGGDGPMICFDCAALGQAADAVAVCVDCGAGACPGHAHVTPRWLTRTVPISRIERVEVPARIIRCGLCQQARDAEAARPARPARSATRKAFGLP